MAVEEFARRQSQALCARATHVAEPSNGFTPLIWAFRMRAGLTSTNKAVLVSLASYADATGSCYPSIKRIADDTRLSERACQKAVAELETAGFISVNRKTRRGRASNYRLHLER